MGAERQHNQKKRTSGVKGAVRPTRAGSPLRLAAVGLEAEFTLHLDGREVRPEDVFKDPRSFIRHRLFHRVGTSYHLPTGGAVYFDTGVIEVATPVIEIERGCAARAGRSLWEGILFIRGELDDWERRKGHDVRLGGFSTHYNISVQERDRSGRPDHAVDELARLLVHLVPIPVMLLAANRRSTGIGVRPRSDRIEFTADFTPSAALMIATATLLTGITREVMSWRTFSLDRLREEGLPVLRAFQPIPHTSRKGWLARYDCFPHNPFKEDLDAAIWEVEDGYFRARREEPRLLSLREIAGAVIRRFHKPIQRISDPFTMRLIRLVLSGRAPSLLELDDRPEEYDDVGRLCVWDNLFPERVLSRSRYERALIRAISGIRLTLQGDEFVPVGLRGWTEVVFVRVSDGSRVTFPIDYLLTHLDRWERQEG